MDSYKDHTSSSMSDQTRDLSVSHTDRFNGTRQTVHGHLSCQKTTASHKPKTSSRREDPPQKSRKNINKTTAQSTTYLILSITPPWCKGPISQKDVFPAVQQTSPRDLIANTVPSNFSVTTTLFSTKHPHFFRTTGPIPIAVRF